MRQGLPIEVQKRHLRDDAIGTRLAWAAVLSILIATLAITGLTPSGIAQELDITRQALAGKRKNLNWENVTGSRQYLRGVRPKRLLPGSPATVKLAPGEATEFLVPSHELVRVVSIDGTKIDNGQTQIWTSNGSGMYRKLISAISDAGCSILAAPNETGYSIAKVCRSASAKGAVRLAIYTSARPPLQTLDYYHCPIVASKCVTISDDHGSRPRDYSSLPAGKRVSFRMPGASRLRLEARLKYDLQPQRRQTFWIRTYVDGHLYRVLSFDTEPESRRRQFVKGNERLLGRREFAYLDLDCGDKSVEVEVSHDCYLRIDGVGLELCRPNLNRSFDYPTWENLKKATTIWDALRFDPRDLLDTDGAAAVAASYGIEPESIHVTGDPIWDPYLNQQRIQAVARDNTIPYGGLRAYMWMLACVARHFSDASYGDEIDLDDLCQRLRSRYTLFLDTPIAQLPHQSSMRKVAYVRRKVRGPKEDRTERIIAAQHLESSLSLIGQAELVAMTDDCCEPLRYRFPRDLGTSVVRLVVDQSKLTGSIRLMVRYDDRSPIELFVSPEACVERLRLVPTTAEAALTAMRGSYGKFDQLTAGGPFAIHRENVPTIRAATAELIKPSNVREMEVWIESCNGDFVDEPIGIGVQHLDGRKSQLSETSYRFLEKLIECHADDDLSATFARRELDNDAFSLEAELRAHHRMVHDSVRRHPIVEHADDPWDDATINAQLELADELSEQENWPAVIDLLSELIRHSRAETKRAAILARLDALKAADEDYLATIELRGWMVHGNDVELRREAFRRLLAESGDDRIQRTRYLAYAAIEWQEPTTELRLAEEFAGASRYRDALVLLSNLVTTPETEDLLLRCSLLEGWWTTFDAAVDRIGDPAKKNLWMGLKQWRLGFYRHGDRTLSAAEQVGKRWLAYGKAATEIFDDLMHAEPSSRLAAIGRWEHWQTQYPGKTRWRKLPGAVRLASGTERVISTERGIRTNYFVASPEHRAEVVVQGPVKLRLTVRLIHPNDTDDSSANDWLHLESGGASTLVPITASRISSSLEMSGRAGAVGQQFETVVEVPRGRSRLRVFCQDHPCLFQVAVERPEISLPFLPPVNSVTMAAVVQGHFGRVNHLCCTTALGTKCRDCVRVFRRDQQCLTTPIQYVAAPCHCTDLDAAERKFNSLPFGDVAAWHDRVVPTEMPVLVHGRSSNLDSAIAIAYESEMRARAEATEAEFRDSDGDPRLSGLIRLHELSRDDDDAIRTLHSRLRTGASWELLREFDSRAGLHSIAIERWTPETPEVRIRRSLMPGVSSRFALSDSSQLKLEVDDNRPTRFEFRLTQPSISFLRIPFASAIIETRSRTVSVRPDAADRPTRAEIEMPAGRGTIGIGMGQRLPNQYLLADVSEIDQAGNRIPIHHQQLRQTTDKRNYHVATADQPLVVSTAGPAILRVDRYQDGFTSSETIRTLEDRVLKLAPPEGTDPALYRIFRLDYTSDLEPPSHSDRLPSPRTEPVTEFQFSDHAPLSELIGAGEAERLPAAHSSNDPATTSNPIAAADDSLRSVDGSADWMGDVVQAAYHEIDEPRSLSAVDSLSLRSGDLFPLSVRFDDWASPRHRPPGTTRFGVRFRSRFADEEIPQPINSDEFVEFKASRLRHHRWADHYTETDVLARTRESGAPTFGIDQRGTKEISFDYGDPFAHTDRWSKLRLDYRGYLLGQFDIPTVAGSDASPDLWTTGFRSTVSRRHHLSSIWSQRLAATLFGRAVRNNSVGYQRGAIDQDVFTRYKSDHPWGFRFSHRLLYQNNLDNRWWAGPMLVTNSDQWVPDYLSWHVGTDQLFGPLQIRLSYRMTGYFADNDRRNSLLQNVVFADLLLAHEHGRNSWSEWSLSIRGDLTNENTSLGLKYVLYFNDGRGFRDFRPGSMVFRSLRDERAARRYLFEP